MKHFDLQEYLKNPGKKIVTRKGKSVRIICTNRLDDRYPVVAFIRLGDDYEDTIAQFKDKCTNLLFDFDIEAYMKDYFKI